MFHVKQDQPQRPQGTEEEGYKLALKIKGNRSRGNVLNSDHIMSLQARQSRAWQSLRCKKLRLLRPGGLAMTQKRRSTTLNGYNKSKGI